MELSKQQRQELEWAARHHQTPHVRVKALVLLNIGRGRSITEVASTFMISRQSVYAWCDRYVAEGVAGLEVRSGRGRKATADPDEIAYYVLQAPDNFGIKQTRWTLRALAQAVPSLRGFSPSGVKRALARAGFSYKRGQPVQHSPDPDYAEKKSRIDETLLQVRDQPDRFVLLYQDELTVYRQPTQGWLWSYMGRRQPKMRYASKHNTSMRIVGYLNAVTGAVHCQDMKSVTAKRLIASLREVPRWYPEAERIYIVLDNWQNHRLPSVLEAVDSLPRVELLWLPTYSPWLNPIEKLWRWLYQTVIHAHRWSEDFLAFRERVMGALAQHAEGSQEMLRYVGLVS